MKKITTLLLALLISGCASTHLAAPQNYRTKGDDNAVQITGKIDKKELLLSDEFIVSVFFNGFEQIKFKLDDSATGDGIGLPYQGKQTSSSCSSKRINEHTLDVRCIVFIDNERTVTLTF